MRTIKIMCGLPRSGKSTWIKNNKTNEVIISADDIRYLVYGQRYWQDGESLMWSIRKIILEYMMKQGLDIIIDETNITKESRKSIIKLAKKYNYYIIGNIIEGVQINTCINRAIESNQFNLIPVINRMAEQFQLLEKEEGFDELNMI